MVEHDVVLAKAGAVDACLQRIADVRGAERAATMRPIDVEEIVVLNLQRACQAVIDLAAHVVATEGYGLIGDLAEAFTLLEKHAVIEGALARRMRAMVGFRNIAVHQYQAVDRAIVESIVEHHLDDLRSFVIRILDHFAV
jgi:uncharacterized protein YutE (UPF0331/DUF86 family)